MIPVEILKECFKSRDTFVNLIRSLLSSVWWQKYSQSGLLLSVVRPSTPLVLGLKTLV